MTVKKISKPRAGVFMGENSYALTFKIIVVIVALAFFCNCAIQTKKLISTRPQTEEATTVYEYQAEETKRATVQDPVVEFKITRTPCHIAKDIQTYEKYRKFNRLPTAILGLVGGFFGGGAIGAGLAAGETSNNKLSALFHGAVIGGLSGLIIPLTIHSRPKKIGTIEKISKTYLLKISAPVPLQNEPLTVKWLQNKTGDVFKTSTDDQGIVRLTLAQDLGIGELKAGQAIWVIFRLMNPMTQQIDALVVSLKIA